MITKKQKLPFAQCPTSNMTMTRPKKGSYTPPFFFSHAETALKQTLKHWKLLILATILELGFFYYLTILHAETFIKVQEHLNVLMTAVQQQTANLTAATAQPELMSGLQASLLQNQQTLAAYNSMLQLLGMFFVYLLLTFIVFQGINWWIAKKMARSVDSLPSTVHRTEATPAFRYGKRLTVNGKQLIQFFLRFTLFSMFWFVMFLAIIVVYVLLQDYSSFSILPLVGKTGIDSFGLVLLFLLSYFATISFGQEKGGLRTVWATGTRFWKELIPAHILVLVLVFVTVGLTFTWMSIHYWLALAWIFLIALPSFTLARVYWTGMVRFLEK